MQTLDPQEVNAFLPKDKWQISALGADELEQEEVAIEKVFGKLASTYPVEDWRTGAAPKLVRSIVAMHVAAWVYARQFSEDTANINSYASWLLRQADDLIAALISGAIRLEDDIWPHLEGDGSAVSGDPVFTMGMAW